MPTSVAGRRHGHHSHFTHYAGGGIQLQPPRQPGWQGSYRRFAWRHGAIFSHSLPSSNHSNRFGTFLTLPTAEARGFLGCSAPAWATAASPVGHEHWWRGGRPSPPLHRREFPQALRYDARRAGQPACVKQPSRRRCIPIAEARDLLAGELITFITIATASNQQHSPAQDFAAS